MEADVRALVERLKIALKDQFKIELSFAMYATESSASALAGADARVANAEATLIALVKSAIRKV
jgi:hypothetical protein